MMGRLFIISHLGLEKKRLTSLNFEFDHADQSNRLGQKNNCINHYSAYMCLVASKYGKMYHVKTLWVTLVHLGCV